MGCGASKPGKGMIEKAREKMAEKILAHQMANLELNAGVMNAKVQHGRGVPRALAPALARPRARSRASAPPPPPRARRRGACASSMATSRPR